MEVLVPFQNSPPIFASAIDIPRMMHYNTEFEAPFPRIIDPDFSNTVSMKCFMRSLEISNCRACDIQCKKETDEQYVLKGSYPPLNTSRIMDSTVTFTVELSDEFGDKNTYSF